MSVTNEIRRTLSDPKPLYALAGAGDLAASKLREAPALLTEAAATVTTLANRIAAEAPEQIAKVQTRLAEVQTRLAEVPSTLAVDPRAVAATLDPRTARESIRGVVGNVDTQALRDKAQTLALVQVGRVLEAAGKAVETYDELAERGKVVVERYRGAAEGSDSDVTVVVEQVIVEEPAPAETEAEPKPATAAKSTPSAAKPKVEDAEVTDKPAAAAFTKQQTPRASQAKKTAATPRKRAASSTSSKSAKA